MKMILLILLLQSSVSFAYDAEVKGCFLILPENSFDKGCDWGPRAEDWLQAAKEAGIVLKYSRCEDKGRFGIMNVIFANESAVKLASASTRALEYGTSPKVSLGAPGTVSFSYCTNIE